MKRDQVTALTLFLSLLVSLSATSSAAAANDDWAQWLGPNRDGKTTADNFDPAFTTGGVDIKWSADIGVGFSAVTVADGLAYTAGWKDGNTVFYCFDAKTGKKHWEHAVKTGKYDAYNIGGTRGSATVHDGKVYFVNADGVMFCYQAGDKRKVLWEKNLAQGYGVKPPTWGFSGSPLILGDILYLDMGKTLAFNIKTGKEVWQTEDFGPAYSTPMPFTLKGKDYLAVFPKSGLHILDRKTGKHIAHQPWDTQYGVHAATPVIVDDKILVSSEYNNGCALLQFDGKNLSVVWENRNLRQKMGTSVYHDGVFYGFNSTKMASVDAETGKELWNKRGLGHGTVIMADDTLIVLSDKGELHTAKASRDGFDTIAQARVIEGGKDAWTAPTLVEGLLYARDSRGKLVCIDVAK